MNVAKLITVGAFALSLAACHVPGHGICDDDDGVEDNDRAVCVALIVGAGAALKFIALSSMSEPEPS